MEISINSLVSIEKAISNPYDLFKFVDNEGKAVILKDNKPAYIVLKYDENVVMSKSTFVTNSNYTLQEAMEIVLSQSQNGTLHASKLADIIYEKKLYVQKNGEKAKANQMRARCGHYPDMFEALPGNYIRLKNL